MEQVPKIIQPNPDRQPPLISEPEAPAPTPIDKEIIERLAQENQETLRQQRKIEAEKDPYTDH